MSVDAAIKILVVEDSKITRKMEIKALKSAGFSNIIEADDGQDAVGKLGDQPDVDLIISDWNMPNMNGFDLLVWVRADEKCRDIPFIMATAQSEKKQTDSAKAVGVSNFITKPFGPPELKMVIEDTFSGEGSAVQAEETAIWEPRMASPGKPVLRAAHIQITDHLTLGVMKDQIDNERYSPQSFELETQCMPGWNPVQKALENGEIDAAFILAPIAMDLFGYGVPIKMVLCAHKNGSICVRKKTAGSGVSLEGGLKGSTFYIPHILSIHHMLSNMFLRQVGLKPGLAGKENVDTFFEVVPPVKMPEFLTANPNAGGFTVAEPLGTKAIASGNADLLFLSGDVWKYHPCCVVVFRDEFIEKFPDAVREFTELLIESGQLIAQKPERAAEIAVSFLDPEKKLGLNVPVLKNVLLEPQGIKTDDLYPVKEDLDRIQHYMVDEMSIGTLIDVDKFVDTRFVDAAYDKSDAVRRSSVMHDIAEVVNSISRRDTSGDKVKTNLDREGKYLFFDIDREKYGINVLSVKEIIRMVPIKMIPQMPDFIKGVVNIRGRVIPVIDIRTRLGIMEKEHTDQTCIIILEDTGADEKFFLGIIVDNVSEVLNIKATDIVDTPSFGVKINTEYVMAMAKLDGNVRSLLNVRCLFAENNVEMAVEYVA